MTSGKGVDDLINTLINKKVLKKGLLTMAKILSWHFRHLLWVVWLKKACKRGGSQALKDPPGYAYNYNHGVNKQLANSCLTAKQCFGGHVGQGCFCYH